MKTIHLTKIIGSCLPNPFSAKSNKFTKSLKTNFMKSYLLFVSIIVFINIGFAQENGGPYTKDTNTVLLMHFEDNAENSADVGANGILHGSGVSYETSVDGHGKCIRLDNSTSDKQSWIEVPFYDELNFNEEFSIECWFKINSWGENTDGLRTLFKKEANNGRPIYDANLDAQYNSLQANLDCIDDENGEWGADAGTVNIFELNKWYHIAVYYNHAHKHLYCLIRNENYEEIYATRGYSETPPINSEGKLMIGFGGWNESCFDGWIDEFRISNKYIKYRDDFVSSIDVNAFKDSVYLPLKDKWKSDGSWPLHAYFPKNSETGKVAKGPSCGPTMIMRTIHYWEFPRFPSGSLEYVRDNYHWVADLEQTEYLFDQMPATFGSNPSEDEYRAAATLAQNVSTFSLRYNTYGMPKFLIENFHYSPDTKVLFREEYSKTDWENIFKNELNNGRPIMLGGVSARTSTGGSGHYYVCYGYNSDNKFCTDYSFNDETWVDIDSFNWGTSHDIIVFMEPDWQGKILILDYPQGNEYLQKQTELEIKWSSENITNVLLEYSTDAGKNWQTIDENIDASMEKYLWTIPNLSSEEYKIRVSDSEDRNIYRRSQTFNIFNEQKIAFEYPRTNTYFQAGTTQPIYWQSEGIPTFKLEYSTNNKDWSLLCDSITSNTGIYNCTMPALENAEVVLKATNLTNNEVVFTTDTFRVLPEGLVGGVYKEDENNILLMHFEEDLSNSAKNNVSPYENRTYGTYSENYDLHLGKAFRVNNSENADWHCLMVPHNNELNLNNNWTVETWVKINSLGTDKLAYPLIMEKGQSYGIWLAGDGNGFGGYAKFSDQSEASFFQNQHLEQNKWYHVAITSNSSSKKVKFYVHDEHRKLIFEDSRNFPAGSTGELNHSENDIYIGGVGGGSNIQFDGWFDELRIYKESVDYSSLVTEVNVQLLPTEMYCYPNPLTNTSIVSFTNSISGKVNLSIFDLQGRKICTVLNKNMPQGKHTVSLGNQIKGNGIYFCTLTTETERKTLKLVVNK